MWGSVSSCISVGGIKMEIIYVEQHCRWVKYRGIEVFLSMNHKKLAGMSLCIVWCFWRYLVSSGNVPSVLGGMNSEESFNIQAWFYRQTVYWVTAAGRSHRGWPCATPPNKENHQFLYSYSAHPGWTQFIQNGYRLHTLHRGPIKLVSGHYGALWSSHEQIGAPSWCFPDPLIDHPWAFFGT